MLHNFFNITTIDKNRKVGNAGWKEKEFYGLIIPHSRQPNRDFQGPFSLMLADEPNN